MSDKDKDDKAAEAKAVSDKAARSAEAKAAAEPTPEPGVDPVSAKALLSAFQALTKEVQAQNAASATEGLFETVEGGRYLENGVLVNAWGQRIDDPDKDAGLYAGQRQPASPVHGVPILPGKQPVK